MKIDFNFSKCLEKRGILVCLNQKCEWMFLWWYKNVRKFSNLPIMFVDLGMSNDAKSFCKKNGHYFDGRDFVSYFEKIKPSENLLTFLNNHYPKSIFEIRTYWFSKALASIYTIFEETLFLDLDLRVNYPLENIFSNIEKKDLALCYAADVDLGMFFYYKLISIDEKIYNSGVIVYKHNSEIILKWSKKAFEESFEFLGDQDVLSRVIYENNSDINILSDKWNYKFKGDEENDVYINHYMGGPNKINLFKEIYPNESFEIIN
ncbi:MAG: hypothetical protein A3F40_02360 [Chlamydiae bacterium RIFCSPHIGHO2_12_FULL_27_8]|nr:MAG: hypothetical protein A3F40_02360 [Chlamydiae bacterium RIFCSPHIGHO2_12_FULL_27_8]